MGNMAYCRFENTLNDLRDCYDNLSEEVSEKEETKRKQLIELCKEIAKEFDD